jgi:hypothetical protein
VALALLLQLDKAGEQVLELELVEQELALGHSQIANILLIYY